MNLPAGIAERQQDGAEGAGEDWLQDFLGGFPTLCALLSLEGRVLATNRGSHQDLGFPFTRYFLPDSHADLSRALDEAVQFGQATQVDAAIVNDDGRHGWRLVTFNPVVREGWVTALTAVTIDISDRKREEQRLRRSETMMVDTQGVAHLGVWEWDVSQPHAVWSPQLYLIYGLDAKDHAPTYEDYLKRVHPDDRQRVIDATNAVFHDHKPYSHDERIYRADGELRYLHTWAFPVLDESGKLVRLAGVCQDITDRKLAENAVVEHAANLARANAELEQFARLAAHDLQEPLRTVASFSQILATDLEGRLDASSSEALGYIQQAVARMKAQINDLLRYVKIAAHTAPRTVVDLSDALVRVERQMRDALAATGGAIHSVALVPVMGDGPEIETLLRNLIDNALKFRGPKLPRIEITARQLGSEVEVVVRDDGIGIERRYLDRVFVVFQRLHPEMPGTGIGLSVCKKIVERNGGRIWIESAPGQGTSVHFTLPAVAVAHAA